MVEQDPLVGQCPTTGSFNLKSPLPIVGQCPTTGPFSLKCPQPIVGQSPLGHQSRKSSSGTGKYSFLSANYCPTTGEIVCPDTGYRVSHYWILPFLEKTNFFSFYQINYYVYGNSTITNENKLG